MKYPSISHARLVTLFLLLLFALATIATAQSTLRTREEAAQLAQAFLLKEQSSPPKAAIERIPSSINLQKASGLSPGKIGPIKDELGSILAYTQQLQPRGFIIVSTDRNITPILAFSFDGALSFDNVVGNPLVDLVISDVSARRRLSPNREEPVLQSEQLRQWGPWLATTWTQAGYWNNRCPYLVRYVSGVRRIVGCVATSLAQIINYWRYPKSVKFSNDEYVSVSSRKYALNNAPGWGMPSVTGLRNSMSNLLYNGSSDEEGLISFAAGVKLHMDYGITLLGFGGSAASTFDVASVLTREFRFGSAKVYSKSSGVWSSYSRKVIEDIKIARPVQVAIHKSGKDGGHSVVVDGYRDDGFFHINYGWGAHQPDPMSSAWYNIPTNMPNYDVVHTVVYGISRYQGQNQYGGNATNTFGTSYGGPQTNLVAKKWRATCPAGFSFGDVLIGTSNHLYASASPTTPSGHPFVYVIDQFGTTLKQIEIARDGKIESMCQSEDGDLFAAMENGYIYLIDLELGSATQIFSEPNRDDIYELKIDEEGWLIATTFYRVYALTRTGTPRWSAPFLVPTGAMMLGGGRIPAIDVSRQRMYLISYNSATKHAFLLALNRLDGQIAQTRDFGAITLPSIREVSVGADGALYVRMPGVLYALDPNDLTGTPRWSKSLLATATPALGSDGTLYTAYWEQSGTTWYNKLGAFDPTTGAMRWSVSYLLDPNEEDIFQPFVAADGTVLFTIEHAGTPKTYTLHAYKDNGTSAQELWQYNAGTSGGNYAFGTGGTVYAWGMTGLAKTIHALGDGDVGDPYGAGMNFENNEHPLSVTNPTPADTSMGVDTASVRLSWECSDPDGHALKYDVFVCALVDSASSALVPLASGVAGSSFSAAHLRPGTRYLWSVVASDGQAMTEGPVWSFTTAGTPTSVHNDGTIAAVPGVYGLHQNYPNPFNPSTTIRYELPKEAYVSLKIFNALGQLVTTLADVKKEAGYHQVQWNATDIPSGIYFYRLQAGAFVETKKMVLVR